MSLVDVSCCRCTPLPAESPRERNKDTEYRQGTRVGRWYRVGRWVVGTMAGRVYCTWLVYLAWSWCTLTLVYPSLALVYPSLALSGIAWLCLA